MPKNRIICALDTDNLEFAISLATSLRGKVAMIKLGLEFFIAFGLSGVEKICKIGLPVFLDLKLHDIPRTVSRTISIIKSLDISMLTVHVCGGRATISEALSVLADTKIKLIGVTVLTSLDDDDLDAMATTMNSASSQTVILSNFAKQQNLAGVVCSGHEVKAVRDLCGQDFILVVPGIRLASSVDDQKRVRTPKEAIADGADYLVIGRPITNAPDPLLSIEEIMNSLRP